MRTLSKRMKLVQRFAWLAMVSLCPAVSSATDAFEMGYARFVVSHGSNSNLKEIKEKDQALILTLKNATSEELQRLGEDLTQDERSDLRQRLADLGNIFCYDLRHGWSLAHDTPEARREVNGQTGSRVIDCLQDHFTFYRFSASGARLFALALWENRSIALRWSHSYLNDFLTSFIGFGATYYESHDYLKSHTNSAAHFIFKPTHPSRADLSTTLSQHIALMSVIVKAYAALSLTTNQVSLEQVLTQ